MKRIKLFCIPFAGNSAMFFSTWQKYLDSRIEVHPIELSGRGKRRDVKFCETFDEVVNDIFKLIEHKLNDCEYSFWGHSMGALIAYELNLKLYNLGYKPSVHLFLSGRPTPNYEINKNKNWTSLSDENFKSEILNLGGTCSDIFDNPRLGRVYFERFKADYKVLESYNYIKCQPKLKSRVSIFYGVNDELTKGIINEWKSYIEKEIQFYPFNGGHFFINEYKETILKIINSTLTESLLEVVEN